MPSKTSPEAEEKILALLLAGYTQREISSKVGVAKSTVQKVNQRLYTKFGQKTLEIQSLFSAFRKEGLDEAIVAKLKRIESIVKRLDLDEEKLWEFLEKVTAKAYNTMEPAMLVKYSKMLIGLVKQNPDLPVESLFEKLQEAQSRFKNLQQENERLAQENKNLERENKEKLEEHDTIYDHLATYVDVQNTLAAYGIDIKEEPRLLANILNNVKEWGGNAEAILNRLKREQSIHSRIKEKEAEFDQLVESIGQKEATVQQIEFEIKQKSSLAENIVKMERMGVNEHILEYLLKSIATISAHDGTSIEETVKRLEEFVTNEYAKPHSIEQHIQKLTTRKAQLEKAITELENKFQALEAKYLDQQEAVEKLKEIKQHLRGNPYFDVNLAVDFYWYYVKSGLMPHDFMERLKQYDSMASLMAYTGKQVQSMTADRDKLQSELNGVNAELEKRQKQVEVIINEQLNRIMKKVEEDLANAVEAQRAMMEKHSANSVQTMIKVQEKMISELEEVKDTAISNMNEILQKFRNVHGR